MTPEVTGLPSLLPLLLPIYRQRIIKSKVKIRVPVQCQCFDKRRGVHILEKVSVFLKIRVLFWPEISALGLILITSVCTPLNTEAPPPPPGCDRQIKKSNDQLHIGTITVPLGGVTETERHT